MKKNTVLLTAILALTLGVAGCSKEPTVAVVPAVETVTPVVEAPAEASVAPALVDPLTNANPTVDAKEIEGTPVETTVTTTTTEVQEMTPQGTTVTTTETKVEEVKDMVKDAASSTTDSLKSQVK